MSILSSIFLSFTHFKNFQKEKPSNVFVDEVPIETSWYTGMGQLPILSLLTTNKPLVVGYTIQLTFYIVAFIFSLILSTCIDNNYPLLFWLFMTVGSIAWLVVSATVCFYDLSKTTDALNSIGDLVNAPSSYFWIALQSNFFREEGFGVQPSESDVEKMRKNLIAQDLFYCPVLRNNLRNSKPVTAFSHVTWDGNATA